MHGLYRTNHANHHLFKYSKNIIVMQCSRTKTWPENKSLYISTDNGHKKNWFYFWDVTPHGKSIIKAGIVFAYFMLLWFCRKPISCNTVAKIFRRGGGIDKLLMRNGQIVVSQEATWLLYICLWFNQLDTKYNEHTTAWMIINVHIFVELRWLKSGFRLDCNY
jgi:hypothetical protein